MPSADAKTNRVQARMMGGEVAIRKLRDAHRQIQEVALQGNTGYDISLREARRILSGVIHGLQQAGSGDEGSDKI